MISAAPKLPRPVCDTVYAFPPNRDTLGGTAYLILEETGNILVDCPVWDEVNADFLRQRGVRWLFLTHRGGMGKVKEIQKALGCEVVVQEQEAYLLPGLAVTRFEQEFRFSGRCVAFWTSGHSPGAACLYADYEGGILFTGRHLLPDRQGDPVPLRISKTFHWRRQIESVRGIGERFSAETLRYICPGANTGFLRGERWIDRAYERLMGLDLAVCLQMKPMI
jgi:glyoxylase-like metal-dependent hydrolase (beta-lactamase superfamily II)